MKLPYIVVPRSRPGNPKSTLNLPANWSYNAEEQYVEYSTKTDTIRIDYDDILNPDEYFCQYVYDTFMDIRIITNDSKEAYAFEEEDAKQLYGTHRKEMYSQFWKDIWSGQLFRWFPGNYNGRDLTQCWIETEIEEMIKTGKIQSQWYPSNTAKFIAQVEPRRHRRERSPVSSSGKEDQVSPPSDASPSPTEPSQKPPALELGRPARSGLSREVRNDLDGNLSDLAKMVELYEEENGRLRELLRRGQRNSRRLGECLDVNACGDDPCSDSLLCSPSTHPVGRQQFEHERV